MEVGSRKLDDERHKIGKIVVLAGLQVNYSIQWTAQGDAF